jgi:hypothetical protein
MTMFTWLARARDLEDRFPSDPRVSERVPDRRASRRVRESVRAGDRAAARLDARCDDRERIGDAVMPDDGARTALAALKARPAGRAATASNAG